VHFGELLRRVVEEGRPVIVERGGKPQAVVLSLTEYERLRAKVGKEDQDDALEQLLRLGARIRARRGGQLLTPPEEIIREMREERDEQLLGLR
jgi:prevent-host-death family protein